MTLFEQTLRDLLIQANVVSSRVFLARAPQKPAAQMTYPYIVFFHLAPNPHYMQSGPLETLDREYQIGVFDQSQSTALAIADTLREYLEAFRGDGVLALVSKCSCSILSACLQDRRGIGSSCRRDSAQYAAADQGRRNDRRLGGHLVSFLFVG